MKKEVRVFLKGEAKSSYSKLKNKRDKESQTILNSFERIKKILIENPQFGNPLPKRLIPRKFLKEGIENVYRVELSNYWRMLYSLEGDEINVFLFVLRIFNHKDYNKFFGYK